MSRRGGRSRAGWEERSMSIFPARARARPSSKVSHYDDGVTSYYSDSRYGDDADSQYLDG